jgi:putative transposase
MVAYRRNFVAGGCFFFTVTLRDRTSTLLLDHWGLLRKAYAAEVKRRPWRTEALVLLPEHLHAIWTLPDGDADFSGRWRGIKAGFVRELAKAGIALSRNAKGEADIWQRRFWEHSLRDEADFAAHCDYIHFNPVKHGHVARALDWPHSSFHRWVARGVYPADWGQGGVVDLDQNMGER